MLFEPWQLAAIDEAGYNGIRDEHIERVAEKLLESGLTEIDWQTFADACRECNIDPNTFAQADLDRLQDRLRQ